MNNESRTANSVRNTLFSVIGQALSILLSFGVRFVFIKMLPTEYLGLNGLFTSVLTILSLAELGIGTAITYAMYKPIAEKNEEKICILMKLYAHVYIAIGFFVAIVGTVISPFLGKLIKDLPDMPGLTGIYFIFLFDTVASYFFAYKRSLISADQRESVLSINHLYFILIKSMVQIVILIIFKNFYLYLFIQVACTLCENIRISFIVDKLYPFLKEYKGTEKLSKQEKTGIIENIKALFIYKASSVFLGGIDNLVISSQIGVICVAVYSNYLLIVNSLTNVINMFTASITASIGNFVATEGKNEQKKLFERVVFVVFLLYGFSSTCLYSLLTPFMEIYGGKHLLLSNNAVVLVVVNFFIVGMMSPLWTFRTTMGLFIYGRWRPVISALINFGLSMILAGRWGIEGVLIATAISRITTNLWFDPYIVYKKGWGISPTRYYLTFAKYAILVLVSCVGIDVISEMIGFSSTVLGFIFRLICVVGMSGVFYLVIVMLNPEKNYFLGIAERILQKVGIRR